MVNAYYVLDFTILHMPGASSHLILTTIFSGLILNFLCNCLKDKLISIRAVFSMPVSLIQELPYQGST